MPGIVEAVLQAQAPGLTSARQSWNLCAMKHLNPHMLLGLVCTGLILFHTNHGLAGDSAPAAIAPAGRIELFNGRDFSGWTFCLRTNAEPSQTWTVTNGVMHCAGQPFGYLRTEKSYRDYKLTIEWRFVKAAPRADNSGVLLHVQPPDNVWPKCIESQGQYQHQGDLILLGGATCKGHETPQTRVVRSASPHNEKPAGEWNTYEIVCRGDTLKSYVNGKLMNEATACSVTSGTIAIQSEGGEWELRKIHLDPAPAAP
jgi:hypothetical protein